MRREARHGGRWSRVAAWSMLAFLPMAAMAAIPFHADAAGSSSRTMSSSPPSAARMLDGPTVEALLRGWRSDMFGSFSWDGTTARGSFVEFNFSGSTGRLGPFVSRQGNDSPVMLDWTTTVPSSVFGPPIVEGPIFIAQNANLTVTAHDDASGLIEFRTLGAEQVVALHLNGTVTAVTGATSAEWWPQATLSFTAGGNEGRLFLGAGSFQVSGSTVYATMSSNDLLAVRITPSSAEAKDLRGAMMTAFGSGRLAAEFGLVSKVDGGWVEDSARYRRNLVSATQHVLPGNASIRLSSMVQEGGLVVLSFDPTTMPADAGHRIVLGANGTAVPEADNPYTLLYGNLSPENGPVFVRLDLSATAFLVYLPSLGLTTVEVTSVPSPPAPVDIASEAAAVAALALVSVAAAVMFRRPDT